MERSSHTFSLSGFARNATFSVKWMNQLTMETTDEVVTSDGVGNLNLTVPSAFSEPKYDCWFSYDIKDANGTIVASDSVNIVKPYVTYDEVMQFLGGTTSEAKIVEYERIARLWINSILGFKFEFVRKLIPVNGNGTDYLPIHDRILRIFSIAENGLPFERPVTLIDYNKTITIDDLPPTNRDEYHAVLNVPSSAFKEDYDYVIDAEVGWPAIPEDIKQAMLLLISDIACGNNRYSGKYIQKHTKDGGGSISYSEKVFTGTGNVIIDDILSRYILDSIRIQVL